MKNCKKLIALCLALATIFSFTVFASAAGRTSPPPVTPLLPLSTCPPPWTAP